MDEMVSEPCLIEKEFCIAVMTGAFSNRNGSGSQPQKGFSGGANELSVCIHGFVRDVLHKVGFEQDGFPTDIKVKESNAVVDKLIELFRVLICRENGDSRSGRSDISNELSSVEIRCQRRTGRGRGGKEMQAKLRLAELQAGTLRMQALRGPVS